LKTKQVLITGGAKGIGLSISEKLAQEGWDLFLCGREKETLQKVSQSLQSKYKVQVQWASLDLGQENPIETLFSLCPSPTAMVCNASNYGELGFLGDVDFKRWKASFDLNFFSIAEMIHTFIRQNRKTNPSPAGEVRKKIVVMSGGGLGGSRIWPGASAYSVAKAALYRLVEVVHQEVHDPIEQGFPIDINCVAPGAVKTGMTEQAVNAGKKTLQTLYDEQLKVYQEGGDSPKLAAEMVAFLLSLCGDGISGRLLSAKWDLAKLKNPSAREQLKEDRNLFCLRRIDQELFK
jgi:short-subunit dehydrogenase